MSHLLGYTRRKKPKAPEVPKTGFFPSMIRFFASGAYSGHFPVAPGTAGSLVGVAIWYTLARLPLNPFGTFLLLLGFYLFGVWVSTHAERIYCKGDAPVIVIDEILGFLIAASFFTPGRYTNEWRMIVVLFVIYRLLDILKPFPVGRAEKLPAGWGVMTDDVLAGFITLLIGYLPFEWFWKSWLGLAEVVKKVSGS